MSVSWYYLFLKCQNLFFIYELRKSSVKKDFSVSGYFLHIVTRLLHSYERLFKDIFLYFLTKRCNRMDLKNILNIQVNSIKNIWRKVRAKKLSQTLKSYLFSDWQKIFRGVISYKYPTKEFSRIIYKTLIIY